MTPRAQVGVAVSGIFFGLIWLAIGVWMTAGSAGFAGAVHRDSTTIGTVAGVEQYHFRHAGQSDQPICYVTATYTINQIAYTRKSQDSGPEYCALTERQSILVRYDRDDPGDGYPDLRSRSPAGWPVLVVPLLLTVVSLGILGGCVRRIVTVTRP